MTCARFVIRVHWHWLYVLFTRCACARNSRYKGWMPASRSVQSKRADRIAEDFDLQNQQKYGVDSSPVTWNEKNRSHLTRRCEIPYFFQKIHNNFEHTAIFEFNGYVCIGFWTYRLHFLVRTVKFHWNIVSYIRNVYEVLLISNFAFFRISDGNFSPEPDDIIEVYYRNEICVFDELELFLKMFSSLKVWATHSRRRTIWPHH